MRAELRLIYTPRVSINNPSFNNYTYGWSGNTIYTQTDLDIFSPTGTTTYQAISGWTWTSSIQGNTWMKSEYGSTEPIWNDIIIDPSGLTNADADTNYALTFDVMFPATAEGDITISAFGETGTPITKSGRYTQIFYNSGTTSQILITPSSQFTGGITGILLQSLRSKTISLDLFDEEAFNITFKIADDLTTKASSYSKTITIPGTPKNNKAFSFLFDEKVWVDLQTADQVFFNKKLPAAIFDDTLQLLTGIFELGSVTKVGDTFNYSGTFTSTNRSFADAVGEKKIRGNDKITDNIDFSEWDHIFNQTNILLSHDTNGDMYKNGCGFYYPFINFDGKEAGSFLRIQSVRPSFYVKELWDKIFSGASYSYQSTFLESDFFKSLIVPLTKDYTEDGFITENMNFKIGLSKDYSGTTYSATTPHISFHSPFDVETANYRQEKILMDTKTGLNCYDPENQVCLTGTCTGIWTVEKAGNYDINYEATYSLWIEAWKYNNQLFNDIWLLKDSQKTCNVKAYIWKKNRLGINSVISESTISKHNIYGQQTNGWKFTNQLLSVSAPDQELSIGDQIWITMGLNCQGCKVNNISGQEIGFLVERCLVRSLGNSGVTYFYNQYNQSNNLYEGNLVKMNGILPDMKQIDFIKTISDQFNLIYSEDKTQFNSLIIEPYDIFYSATTYIEWTSKVDDSKEIEISRIPYLLDKNAILTTTKDDSDYLLKNYDSSYSNQFGTKIINNPYFADEDYTVKSAFSSHFMDEFGSTNWIMPKIFNYDDRSNALKNNKPTTTRFNYRLMQRKIITPGVMTSGMTLSLLLVNSRDGGFTFGNGTARNYHPYAGHLDNPWIPTIDINFGIGKYYYTNNKKLTTNNCYTKYWKNRINTYIDPNSKYVTLYLRLTPADIANLDFRTKIRIDDSLYILNSIVEWNNQQSTKVELIKLGTYTYNDQYIEPTWIQNTGTPGSPTTGGGGGGGNGGGGGGVPGGGNVFDINTQNIMNQTLLFDNLTGYTGVTNTDGNLYPYGASGIVVGSNNIINVGDFQVFGDNNQVDSPKNYLFGSSNNTLTASNSTILASDNNIIGSKATLLSSHRNVIQTGLTYYTDESGSTFNSELTIINSFDNTVANNSKILIVNSSGNTIQSGLTRTTLINSDNLTVTQSGKTYINNTDFDDKANMSWVDNNYFNVNSGVTLGSAKSLVVPADGFIYIGDPGTNGSFRFFFDLAGDGKLHVQSRKAGVWTDTSTVIDPT